jgi:hypothetical protein
MKQGASLFGQHVIVLACLAGFSGLPAGRNPPALLENETIPQ